ncbi:Phytanoyl-CoA dioxygenase (PhyH) [Rivularia sp. PCC 7116]|uniref:phytanoyl-CoA dioxygenase family protein n=1 Tax=Rivularia sp. PCC 7116 TaxID=373994 RepID=UPI00029EC5D7|nr:phytanoyl-CoA dioxygenase family protein [Rivularia sp. PCC 7116]AFY53329.1 Phytanoyl-CoA dioxygenase (PhyH) [Rivularia sp. PCC 7116]
MYKKIVYKIRNEVSLNTRQLPFLCTQDELNYRVARKRHFDNLPAISDYEQSLIDTIKSEGVAMTSLEALSIPSTKPMFQSAKALMPKIPRSLSQGKNEYVVHATPEQILEHKEIFLWGLEQPLINIVENYIGLPVAYHGAYYRRDTTNPVQLKSRLWHIDPEDRRVLKVIIYLNDVNEKNGPFEYIPQSFTDKIISSLRYKYGYVQDRTMEKVISPLHFKSCLGVAGTVVFASTGSIFHRGKIPISSDRYTLFFDYTSRNPIVHNHYGASFLSHEHIESLAKNLTPQQKECVFWKENSW